MTWQRSNDAIPGIPEEEDIFERPGDVRSIPRDGKPKDEDNPEMLWQRTPNDNIPGIPDEDDVFSRPGDVRSIPRDGLPKNPDEPDYGWQRFPSDSPEEPFFRPNVKTVPHEEDLMKLDFVPEEEPDFDWSTDKPDDMAFKGESPDQDWSGAKPESEFHAEQPFYDWSGARPEKLRANPPPGAPDMDWSADRPEDSWYKKDEPHYDWTGARPEGPFDRPSVTTATETDEDLELAPVPDDDMSEFEEEDEDKPPPVTGVPCAAWTMLALGAVAGAAAATGPAAGMPAPSPDAPAFFANNPNQPTATDAFFPGPNTLVPCANDPSCNVVMDGLGPYIPPGTMELFDIPGTCQSKARDWLRTGEDVLEFNGERIRQRYAMTVFFCEQDGGDWLENDMWLSDLHECDWYNMIGLDPCNRVEQMEMIRIHGNGLQGTLPSELSIVSTIYELTLSDNLITGTFPTDYAQMTELDTFVIAFNQFEGPIPGYFFRFPDMVYWDIGFNKFEGTLPQDIPTRMPDLQVMFAENNQLTGTIPSNLGTLDLSRVHLDDNALTGTIPPELGNPPNLKELFLHGNQLNGPIPDTLANNQKMTDATFHYNNLEGEVSQNICENMYQGSLKSISVDCETVTCECCICGEPGV